MIRVEKSIVIDRSIDDVFAYVADQPNAVHWQSGIVEIRRLSDGPPGVGTRHAFVRTLMGRQMAGENEYVDYEPGRRVAFRTTSGPPCWRPTSSSRRRRAPGSPRRWRWMFRAPLSRRTAGRGWLEKGRGRKLRAIEAPPRGTRCRGVVGRCRSRGTVIPPPYAPRDQLARPEGVRTPDHLIRRWWKSCSHRSDAPPRPSPSEGAIKAIIREHNHLSGYRFVIAG